MFVLILASVLVVVVLVDLWSERRAVPAPELAIRPDRFTLPGKGIFLTENHLTAVLSGGGLMWMEPDSFLKEAAGSEGRIDTVSPLNHVRAGEPLFALTAAGQSASVAAPFSGQVVRSTVDGVLFRPDDLAQAVRRMQVGETASTWWQGERHRLGQFLASIHGEALSLADGGDLVAGYLTHLPPDAFRTYENLFLTPAASRRAANGRA